ncbi:MAG: tyrosine-type recombinase/integrase [Brevinema sp.]
MGIYKRENGVYYLQANSGNGEKRKISLETKNKALAQEIYQAFLLDRVKAKLGLRKEYLTDKKAPVCPHPTNLVKEYKDYIESCKIKGFGSHTLQRKAKLLEAFIRYKIVSIKEINQQNLNKLFKVWENTPKDTVIKHLANIKAFLNYCIKKRLYDRADYEALSFPNLRVSVRDTIIPENDYKKLVQTARGKDFKLYLQTLWETGCRPSELLPMKKDDIDFNKGIAKIYQSKTKKYKIVYLTDELLSLFEGIQSDQIFEGYNRQKEYYGKLFKELREKLNFPKEYCLYAFRHSFGTRMLNKTKDIHLVSKLLGHSDISITAKHYINRNTDEIREKLLEAHHNKD